MFAGQKIQNVNAVSDFDSVLNKCKRNDVMTSGSATEGYIIYVSIDALKLDDKGQVTDTVAGADGEAEPATLDTHVANRILSAIGVTETVTDGTNNNYTLSASSDYAMWNFEEGDKTYYFNIYWTSDINPTLIAFMGGNVAGESADDEPGVETVNVTVNGATPETTTVNKGEAVTLELTVETPNARYSVIINGDGEHPQTITAEGTTLKVPLTEEDTASAVTIEVIAA